MWKRLGFFWGASFASAVAGYYLLWAVLPGHYVFGALYRMFLYHQAHPLPYIALCCFFYGLLATGGADRFGRLGAWGRVGATGLLGALTVALSAPFGGMLWHFHDMQAGYFPPDWPRVLLSEGPLDGWAVGWLIVLLSGPYTLLGLVVCYFLTSTGTRLFRPAPPGREGFAG